MATRGRGRAAEAVPSAPPEIRRSTRNTRQTTTQSSAPLTSSRATRREEPPQSQFEPLLASKLATTEPPRRGARPRGPASIVSSIATHPPHADSEIDNSDEAEDNAEEEAELHLTAISPRKPETKSPGRQMNEFILAQSHGSPAVSPEVKQQLMALSLADLFKASQDLMELLTSSRINGPVLQGRIRIKRNAFLGVREIYGDPDESLFIDVADISRQIPPTEPSIDPSIALEHANLTSAFDFMGIFGAGYEEGGLISILEALDGFPSIFPYGVNSIQDSESMHLAIRTAFLTEALADASANADPYEVLASIFCDLDDSQDLASRLKYGPFRSLADRGEATVHEICLERVQEIMTIIKKNKRDFGVKELRATFPLDELMDDLKQWISTVYAALDALSREGNRSQSRARHTQPDVYHGAEEEIADSVAGSDSQQIIRATDSQQMESLYKGPESRRFLDEQARDASQTPPSNQQQQRPPPGAPRDYPQHSNAQLLSDAPIQPVSSGLLPLEPTSSHPNGNSKRKRLQSTADEEDIDEDDPFETDTRPVNPARKPIPSSLPDPKRRRLVDSTAGTAISDKTSMPPPPIPSRSRAPGPESSSRSAPSSSSSSAADFNAIRQQKLALSQEARRFNSSEKRSLIKQRQVWLAEDCETLINLIRERQAAWADIEHNDAHRFVHPRNQQAYRDKARNMKVDFLLTDIVLPPGFDLVALGKKEVDRVIGLGKNPYRKESDLDAQGNPIRTEYQRPRIGE